MRARILPVLWILVCLSANGITPIQAQQAFLTPRLEQHLAATPAATVPVLIVLKEQVDVQALHHRFRAEKYRLEKRVATLLPALQQVAESTQPPLLDFLRHAPGVVQQSLRSFWIVNMIAAEVSPAVLPDLLQREEVAYIDWDAPLQKVAHVCEEQAAAPASPDGIEPGLAAIHAPALWQMGYTGYGRVGYIMDTGVDPLPPAIAYQYRGLYRPDAECWYSQNGAQTPYDCDGHGTHVTGTTMGLDRLNNDTIGVAFNAQWMGGAVLCGLGTSDNIGGFQWAMNPDGDVNTIDDMPDAINNSWYDPTISDDCNNVYVSVLEAMEAAGLAVIFSAGNEGPDEQTITPPHNININLVNSFTVGALNGNVSSLPIASFSSRGPSVCGGDSSLLIKPEVAAPGVQVRSCVPGGYDYYNGTSMAAPHVTGAVLLLKEAFPYLPGEELKYALYYSCMDLGDEGEDNTYGMGIIQVDQAFDYLVAQGYEPVPPAPQNRDLLLLDVQVQPVYCAGDFFASLLVENGGTDTITSFALHLFTSDESVNETVNWTGQLLPSERLNWDVPVLNLPQGQYELWFEILQPNGMEDDRPLNNRLRKNVKITDRPYVEAEALLEDSLCSGVQVVLSAQTLGAGEPVYDWYLGGELFAQGNPVVSPPLQQDTTFSVQLAYRLHTGMESRDLGNYQEDMATQDEGLVFDAYAPFTLKSVKVYAESPGIRIIYLRDGEGNFIGQRLVSLSQTGEHRINLDLLVPAGENMKLILEEGVPLVYNTSGMDFPYEVEDILLIKYSKTYFGNSQQWYMYFYDWEISYEEFCGPAVAEVSGIDTTKTAPVANFGPRDTSLYLENGTALLAFSDSSQQAIAHFWDFDDGFTSVEQNPVHAYTAPALYRPLHRVYGEAGCSSVEMGRVEVLQSTGVQALPQVAWPDVRVFPNPAEGGMVVWSFSQPLLEPLQWRLLDAHGRICAQAVVPARSTTWQQDFSARRPGLYFWQLTSPAGEVLSGKLLVF